MKWKVIAHGSNQKIKDSILKSSISSEKSMRGRISSLLKVCDQEFFILHSLAVVDDSHRSGKLSVIFSDILNEKAELVRIATTMRGVNIVFAFLKSNDGIDIYCRYKDENGKKNFIVYDIRKVLKQVKNKMLRKTFTADHFLTAISKTKEYQSNKYRAEGHLSLYHELCKTKLNIDHLYIIEDDNEQVDLKIIFTKGKKIFVMESCYYMFGINYKVLTYKILSDEPKLLVRVNSVEEGIVGLYSR